MSLHAISFPALKSFSLVRVEAYPRLVDGVPVYDNLIDDIACLKPVPQDFVDKVCGAKSLTILECDWWAWSIADLKAILDNCTDLEVRICLRLFFCMSYIITGIDDQDLLGCTLLKAFGSYFSFFLASKPSRIVYMCQSCPSTRNATSTSCPTFSVVITHANWNAHLEGEICSPTTSGL